MSRLTDFSARATDGSDIDLATYAGQVALVVSTASRCGYAAQLASLQELHDRYADRGFTVLGFPSDQFRQEPLADEEMQASCQRNFGVTFPLFGRIDVNGSGTDPLYRWLRSQKRGLLGSRINWNFTKFLVGRDGRVIARYAPSSDPAAIADDIEAALDGSAD